MQASKIIQALVLFTALMGVGWSSPMALVPDLEARGLELSNCSDPDEGFRLLVVITAAYSQADPNPAVVAILTKALRHPLHPIKCQAAVLLGLKVATDEAVPALLRMLSDVKLEREDIIERAAKLQADGLPVAVWAEVFKLEEESNQLHEFQTALLAGLMEHQDDRCIEAVVAYMPLYQYADANTTFADYLLKCGTQQSIGGVVQVFVSFGEKAKLRAEDRKKEQRSKGQARPKDDRKSASAWRTRVKKQKKAALQRFDDKVAALETIELAFSAHVREYAKEIGLGSPPRGVKGTAWKAWWKRHKASFPPSLTSAN